MALDDVTDRLERIASAFEAAKVDFALVGGQAVALWVATKDPAAVRTTKDVDLLLRRADLPRARAAAASAGFDYFEVMRPAVLSHPPIQSAPPCVDSGRCARGTCRQPRPASMSVN